MASLNPDRLPNGSPLKKMTLEYEPVPPGVEASDLQIGEPVCLVRRGRRREGSVAGIQFALAPYGRDTVRVRLDAGGRVDAVLEELEWIRRREE